MKRVAVWPSPWNYKLGNGIFEQGFGPGGAYIRAFHKWRVEASNEGFQIDTWDLVPAGEADVVWFVDLPRKRDVFDGAKILHPDAKRVLMVCESPLICPGMFVPGNRSQFDHVVTYEQSELGRKVTNYRLPVTLDSPRMGPRHSGRKLVCMINSNRVEGFFAMRQRGLTGLPGVGSLFDGWKGGILKILGARAGDLYPERRRICRYFDTRPELAIEIFGKGWQGEQISWFPGFPNRPYRSCVETFVSDRLEVISGFRFALAYENWEGSADYITDRLFDALLAGTVPVYLGDRGIQEILPEECFVDASRFQNHKDLLDFLSLMTEREWDAMREAGARFLLSETARQFSDETFARRLTDALAATTG